MPVEALWTAAHELNALCRGEFGGGQPSSTHFTHITGTATITGVGFWDFKHGQTGVAPNAIELHPVLTFSGSCS